MAAWNTAFYLNDLNLLLDAGLPCRSKLHAILITHVHTDHCQALARILEGREHFGKPVAVLVPAPAVRVVQDLLLAYYRLACCNADAKFDLERDFHVTVVGMEPGDRWEGGEERKEFVVEALPLDHGSMPCVGYRIGVRVERLRPELLGLPGHRIAEMRLGGECVTVPHLSWRLAYLLDCSVDSLRALLAQEEPVARSIICECTFLELHPEREQEAIELADRNSHVDWPRFRDLIAPHLPADMDVWLTHVSKRYDAATLPSADVELARGVRVYPALLPETGSATASPPRSRARSDCSDLPMPHTAEQ